MFPAPDRVTILSLAQYPMSTVLPPQKQNKPNERQGTGIGMHFSGHHNSFFHMEVSGWSVQSRFFFIVSSPWHSQFLGILPFCRSPSRVCTNCLSIMLLSLSNHELLGRRKSKKDFRKQDLVVVVLFRITPDFFTETNDCNCGMISPKKLEKKKEN